MGALKLPDLDAIAKVVSGLLGRGVKVTAADGSAEVSHAGIFLFRDDSLGMVAGGDLAAVAYCGSALTMIPKGAADDAIADNDLGEMQIECFQEVLNVTSQAWNLAGGDHIRLVDTKPVGALDGAQEALLSGGSTTLHVDVEVEGYGTGRISFAG